MSDDPGKGEGPGKPGPLGSFPFRIITRNRPEGSANMEEKSAAAVLAEMERDRDELTNAINIFRRRMGLAAHEPLNGGGSSTGTGNQETLGGPSGPIELTRDMFFGMKLPEAIRSYLAMVKRPTRATAMVKALIDGGFQSTSGNFDGLVRQALSSRMPDVVNLPNGWALAA